MTSSHLTRVCGKITERKIFIFMKKTSCVSRKISVSPQQGGGVRWKNRNSRILWSNTSIWFTPFACDLSAARQRRRISHRRRFSPPGSIGKAVPPDMNGNGSAVLPPTNAKTICKARGTAMWIFRERMACPPRSHRPRKKPHSVPCRFRQHKEPSKIFLSPTVPYCGFAFYTSIPQRKPPLRWDGL